VLWHFSGISCKVSFKNKNQSFLPTYPSIYPASPKFFLSIYPKFFLSIYPYTQPLHPKFFLFFIRSSRYTRSFSSRYTRSFSRLYPYTRSFCYLSEVFPSIDIPEVFATYPKFFYPLGSFSARYTRSFCYLSEVFLRRKERNYKTPC
jgi:hypothetical protein